MYIEIWYMNLEGNRKIQLANSVSLPLKQLKVVIELERSENNLYPSIQYFISNDEGKMLLIQIDFDFPNVKYLTDLGYPITFTPT